MFDSSVRTPPRAPTLCDVKTTSAVPAEERQVNLLLALRNTAAGLDLDEILTGVHGYEVAPGAVTDSARRMFERDKETLRRLGVPLVALETPSGTRYRVDEEDYALPEVTLTGAQAAALDLAASAWRDGTLPTTARHALTKLRAVTDDDAEPGVLPDLSVDLPGQEIPDVLVAAVHDRRRVAFDYTTAWSATTRRRTVEPHALRLAEGAWYLDALDVDRGEPRTFRLARISGSIEPLGEAGAFAPPTRSRVTERVAVLALAPGRGLGLRQRARHPEALPVAAAPVPSGDWDVLEVTYSDPFGFAGSLASLADGVVVLAPASLREDVLAHLRGAAALAAGGTGTEED